MSMTHIEFLESYTQRLLDEAYLSQRLLDREAEEYLGEIQRAWELHGEELDHESN